LTPIALRLRDSSNGSARKNPDGRRPWIGELKNRLAKRDGELTPVEATDLFARAMDLLGKAVRLGAAPAALASRAKVMRDFRPPTNIEIKGIVEAVADTHGSPEQAKALQEGLDLIKRMQCRVELMTKK
jgi:hypothetical protein